jgi:hypothetical protein
MIDYEAKRVARIERMKDRAASKRQESASLRSQAEARADRIPLGQPILLGHYSEHRDRRFREKISRGFEKSFEALKEAEALERRASNAESNESISSDDPEALTKLREKLAEHERLHDVLLEANRRLRAGTAVADVALLLTPHWGAGAESRLRIILSLGNRTIPLGNSSAEGRRLKQRIEDLEKRAASGPRERVDYPKGVHVEESDNRVRIHFPGKPDETTRQLLRSRGFLWSPRAEAWQRQATPAAWHVANEVAAKIAGPALGAPSA